MKCYQKKKKNVSPCWNIRALLWNCEKGKSKMNNPIYYFYLAAKHSNMFMAIQISQFIGFSIYMTQLGEVS